MGEDRAFGLVERYRAALLRASRRYLPEARAEDALQQAFISAWSALQRGDQVRDLRAWLYRIVHNTALNQLRVAGYDYAELEDSLRGTEAPQEEMERRTKVRAKYLRLLEDERFDQLPGHAYTKGFLQVYANALGLDGRLYVEEYNSRYVADDETVPRVRRTRQSPAHRRVESSVLLITLAGIAVTAALVIVAWKYSGETPGKGRRQTCLDQYRLNKVSNSNGGLKWVQKGGGYYSECNKRLRTGSKP